MSAAASVRKSTIKLVDPEDYSQSESQLLIQPDIRLYQNFLSDQEIQELMDYLITKKFAPSETEEDYGQEARASSYRTSWTYFLPESYSLGKVIKKRVAKTLNCRLKDIEPLQIVRYQTGQYYKTHHDSQLDDDDLHRDHTFFVYLNTIRNGTGGTNFPYLHLTVLPRKGYAVYWKNLRADRQGRIVPDGRMRHRGEVVQDAQKYGMNIWVRTARQDINS